MSRAEVDVDVQPATVGCAIITSDQSQQLNMHFANAKIYPTSYAPGVTPQAVVSQHGPLLHAAAIIDLLKQ